MSEVTERLKAPEDPEFPIWLGYDPNAHAMVSVDMAKIGHLLAVGADDSGRANFLNAAIADLATGPGAYAMRYMMYDPTGAFSGWDPFITSVYTDDEDFRLAILWLAGELEQRRTLLHPTGLASLAGYNRAVPTEYQKEEIIFLTGLLGPTIRRVPEAVAPLLEIATNGKAFGLHLALSVESPDDLPTQLIRAIPVRIAFAPVNEETVHSLFGRDVAPLVSGGEVIARLPRKPSIKLAQIPISDERLKAVVRSLVGDPLPADPDQVGAEDDSKGRYQESVDGREVPAADPGRESPYLQPYQRDVTGLFYVPPSEKGWFNDQGCCGPIGIGILVSIGVIWWGFANSGDPVALVAVAVALVLVVAVVRILSSRM
jgi:DNA segregation ATPase FtsK/SpoIIIE-like protein